MSDHDCQNFIELLDTDYDGQDVFFADDLDRRDDIAKELVSEEILRDEAPQPESDLFSDASLADETPQRRMLKRDLRKQALQRLEDAARTEADFHNVLSWWDRLDANRERRERYHEISRSGDALPLEAGAAPGGAIFPASLNQVHSRQLRRGEFTDVIHYCPYEVQDLVTDDYVYRAISRLPDDRKQLLFLRAVEYMSTVKIAEIRGQSDRNVRKIWATLKKRLRKQCAADLTARKEKGRILTLAELQFLEEYSEKKG